MESVGFCAVGSALDAVLIAREKTRARGRPLSQSLICSTASAKVKFQVDRSFAQKSARGSFGSLWKALHSGKRLSDAASKLARRTGADGVG